MEPDGGVEPPSARYQRAALTTVLIGQLAERQVFETYGFSPAQSLANSLGVLADCALHDWRKAEMPTPMPSLAPSRFERAPQAAAVSLPCWRRAMDSNHQPEGWAGIQSRLRALRPALRRIAEQSKPTRFHAPSRFQRAPAALRVHYPELVAHAGFAPARPKAPVSKTGVSPIPPVGHWSAVWVLPPTPRA